MQILATAESLMRLHVSFLYMEVLPIIFTPKEVNDNIQSISQLKKHLNRKQIPRRVQAPGAPVTPKPATGCKRMMAEIMSLSWTDHSYL